MTPGLAKLLRLSNDTQLPIRDPWEHLAQEGATANQMKGTRATQTLS